MTALPTDRTGQGAEVFGQSRGFMRQEQVVELGDQSQWTDTPKEKEKKELASQARRAPRQTPRPTPHAPRHTRHATRQAPRHTPHAKHPDPLITPCPATPRPAPPHHVTHHSVPRARAQTALIAAPGASNLPLSLAEVAALAAATKAKGGYQRRDAPTPKEGGAVEQEEESVACRRVHW